MDREIAFAVETIWYEAPFAVHQFWPHLHANSRSLATKMIEHCPEALSILPQDLIMNHAAWRDIVCAARPDQGVLGVQPVQMFYLDQLCA